MVQCNMSERETPFYGRIALRIAAYARRIDFIADRQAVNSQPAQAFVGAPDRRVE